MLFALEYCSDFKVFGLRNQVTSERVTISILICGTVWICLSPSKTRAENCPVKTECITSRCRQRTWSTSALATLLGHLSFLVHLYQQIYLKIWKQPWLGSHTCKNVYIYIYVYMYTYKQHYTAISSINRHCILYKCIQKKVNKQIYIYI